MVDYKKNAEINGSRSHHKAKVLIRFDFYVTRLFNLFDVFRMKIIRLDDESRRKSNET